MGVKIRQWLLATLAILIALEIFSFAWFVYPQFGWSSARKILNVGEFKLSDKKSQCHWNSDYIIHPHLGFVRSPKGECGDEKNVDSGFANTRPIPLINSPQDFDILILGASVAEMLSFYGKNRLESELNNKFTGPRGENIRVHNGATAAAVWPQQLNALAYLHSRIDAVLVLDGFNEIDYTRKSYMFGTPSMQVYQEAREKTKSNGQNLRRFLGQSPLGYSYTALAIYFALYEREQKNEYDYAYLHQFPEGFPREQREKHNARLYGEAVKQLSGMAKATGLLSAHFFQPMACYRKPCTPQERTKSSYVRPNFREEYALYQEQFKAALKTGINGKDLSGIFEKEQGKIYKDAVHFSFDHNFNSRGYDLLIEEMMPVLQKTYKLKLRVR